MKKGDQMFKIADMRAKAKLGAELADVLLAELEYENAKRMFEKKRLSLKMTCSFSRPN